MAKQNRLSLSPLYKTWERMRNRCLNPNYHSWHRYGGRGITICKRWDSFDLFVVDMGPHPGKGYSLDRKRNAKGYCKSNCRWVTARVQGRNRATTKLSIKKVATIRSRYSAGERQVALAQEFDVPQSIISRIVNNRIWT